MMPLDWLMFARVKLAMTPSGQRLKNLTTYGRADVDLINCEDQKLKPTVSR
jgi:hypothetical protein